MTGKDISGEKSRSYRIYVCDEGLLHEIIIDNPKLLFWEPGHSFHRIFDGGQIHLAPVPGILENYKGEIVGYVEMDWEPSDKTNPCQF